MNPERSKIITAILAHNEPYTHGPISRHLPFWTKHSDLIFMSPHDKPLKIQHGHKNEHVGQSGHVGVASIYRLRQNLKRLEQLAPAGGAVVIHQFDSVIISPELPEIDMGALNCIVFANHEPARFSAETYLHPVWVIPSLLFPAINNSARSVPDTAEETCQDRWLPVVLERAKIPITCFPEGSFYSQNTILPEHYDSFRKAAKEGASIFHGLKSQESFDILMEESPLLK